VFETVNLNSTRQYALARICNERFTSTLDNRYGERAKERIRPRMEVHVAASANAADGVGRRGGVIIPITPSLAVGDSARVTASVPCDYRPCLRLRKGKRRDVLGGDVMFTTWYCLPMAVLG